MASKLTLRFSDTGTENATITIATGITYVFKEQRLGFRQVGVGSFNTRVRAERLAGDFMDAFNIDDNYTNQFTLTYSATALDASGVEQTPTGTLDGIVTIEHPDNTFFSGFISNAAFVQGSITTTAQQDQLTLNIALSQSPTNPCGKFNLNIQSNVISGRVVIEIPVGNVIVDLATGMGSGFNYNLDRLRPSGSVTGIVKLYETEFAANVYKSVLFNAPPVLSIQSVDITGSPFGAVATINSTTGLERTYSFNGLDYVSSNTRASLLAGNYTSYVKDAFGCIKSKTFVITEDEVQGLTVPEFFEIAKHNGLNFVDRSQNNFLGHISEEITANAPIRVFHDHLNTDLEPIQFKSSFKSNTVKIFGCGTEEDVTVIQKSNNINRWNIYEGNYTAKQGKLAVHFTSGNIYELDGTTPKAEGHLLNGSLPLFYKPGVYLRIEGVGVTQIDRILFEADIAYAITNIDAGTTVAGVTITSVHSEHPYEVFEFNVSCNKPLGNYIVTIDNGKNEFWSEVIRIQEKLSNKYLRVKWWNAELNDQIIYSTGIKPFRWIKYDKYFTYVGQNEREIHSTDTSIKLIKSKSKAVYELDFGAMNMEMAHGLVDGLNHADHVDIEGAVFICNSSASVESFGNWYFVKCELALIGQSVESLEADLSQINTQFLKVNVNVDGVGFLRV